jgi:hypothetical protein
VDYNTPQYWQRTAQYTERASTGEAAPPTSVEPSFVFEFGTNHMANVTTRAQQLAEASKLAPTSADLLLPAATPTAALQQLRPAVEEADRLHSQLEATRQQQLVDAAAAKEGVHAKGPRKASKAPPVLQLRPQPLSFSTKPMPLGIPAANLPDPVRRARAGAIAIPAAPDPGLEQQLALTPDVQTVADAGAAVSLQSMIGLGTGVLEGLLADGAPAPQCSEAALASLQDC